MSQDIENARKEGIEEGRRLATKAVEAEMRFRHVDRDQPALYDAIAYAALGEPINVETIDMFSIEG